jgi:tetraacyldisaccharide 4'-kinase
MFLLFPWSLIYDLVTRFRNSLYDQGVFKSEAINGVFTLVVGNLSTGGTGKTPMCLYLLSELQKHHSIVYLSRGYGRRSKGFLWVEENSSTHQVGDEAMIVKKNFPNLHVAVCESRVVGARRILKEHPDTSCILLDDAFQHRSLKADFYILLTSYSNPFFSDYVLPMGHLRECRKGAKRADCVVITKCPEREESIEFERYTNKVQDYVDAEVYFSKVDYPQDFKPQKSKAIAVSGLAHARDFEAFIQSNYQDVFIKRFPDHHRYTDLDLKQIIEQAQSNDAEVVVTEKDWVKISELDLGDNPLIRILPIKLKFLQNDDDLKNRITHLIVSKLNQYNKK